jgi:hypothetical protein
VIVGAVAVVATGAIPYVERGVKGSAIVHSVEFVAHNITNHGS